MRWSNVGIIFRREVRDQVRDRRTLFMIFVLPILLYPVLGIGIVQFSAAFQQKPRRVVVLGAENLPGEPALLNAGRDGFEASLFDSPAEAKRLEVLAEGPTSVWQKPQARQVGLSGGAADALVTIPPDLKALLDHDQIPNIPIVYKSADELSQTTYLRVREVLTRWKERMVDARLARDRKPASYTEPIRVEAQDVSRPEQAGATVWARIFPFLLVMMALTGAYYPAVDLCAGEKERGTMETLLISPASRAEIVLGKFLTVTLASVVMALLNLASMALTGAQLATQVGALARGGARLQAILAPPSLESALWMILLLVPLAAFFSALSVALAVLAKSMKEGQYYLTPIYLVTFPLTFLAMAPGAELNLFYSLVPITGVSLLLKSLIQGEYGVARRFFIPVLLPTAFYSWVALQWAIAQFQREDVLFRESERFDLGAWVRHLLRDKEPTPNGGEALFCFALMLSTAWFVLQALSTATSMTVLMGAGHIAFILTPPLAMALVLTSDPKRTLRLHLPKPRYWLLAVGLALAFNPLSHELGHLVDRLFPMTDQTRALYSQMMARIPGPWTAFLLLAVIPAISEEVAFRGYILSGLERGHTRVSAIVLSALLFGFLHVLLSLFQQLFNATMLGLVLGLLAIRGRSLYPCILFHLLNNGLEVLRGPGLSTPAGRVLAAWLYRNTDEGLFQYPWIAAGALAAAGLLVVLARSDGGEPKEPEPRLGAEGLDLALPRTH